MQIPYVNQRGKKKQLPIMKITSYCWLSFVVFNFSFFHR